MYLDIPANDNVSEPAMATFKETGPSRSIRAVRLWRDDAWHWCAITGWDEDAAVPAQVAPIEESGDGPALLLHGGSHGLRLATIAEPGDLAGVRWDLADARQWGEPFLLCTPDTRFA